VVGTWDGTNLKTYVNGAIVGSVQTGGVTPDPNTQYRIGRRWDVAYYVTGEIGEVRIYGAPITSDNVLILYNGTKATYSS
jgi:hypothetical protein